MGLTEEERHWIRTELERVETKLLTTFHSWTSPVEMRQRSHSAAFRAPDQEMENLQDGVKKLEQPPRA